MVNVISEGQSMKVKHHRKAYEKPPAHSGRFNPIPYKRDRQASIYNVQTDEIVKTGKSKRKDIGV